jgi:putative transposase
MKYNPERHHRRSIRLKGYDYSQPGWYYITICTHKRVILFGDIIEGEMVCNNAGKMIESIWQEIPQYYQGIKIDYYQIMPNHFHGIIIIVGADPRVCPDPRVYPENERTKAGQSQGIAPTLTLPDVIKRFKSLTTKRYIEGVRQNNWPPFKGKIWKRNYYEHIIRDENELEQIREYIVNNPCKWHEDNDNPENMKIDNRSLRSFATDRTIQLSRAKRGNLLRGII